MKCWCLSSRWPLLSPICHDAWTFYPVTIFVLHATPDVCHLLEPLEPIIRTKFIPTLTDMHAKSDTDHCLFTLPARSGHLGLQSPIHLHMEFNISSSMAHSLVSLLLTSSHASSPVTTCEQCSARSTEQKRSVPQIPGLIAEVGSSRVSSACHGVGAGKWGASNWLTTLTIHEHGFALQKGAFQNAWALRYG